MDHGACKWARSGDVNIAWRAFGDGPMDLVFTGGFISHIEVVLEEPGVLRFFERLAESTRVILMDRRGSGLSDRPLSGWTIEEEAADLEAVMDAAGSERAVLMSYGPGGQLAVEFAATRPERVLALVLYASTLRNVRDDDFEWASDPEERAQRFADMANNWGSGLNLDLLAPSAVDDERMRDWLGRLERQSMTPSALGLMVQTIASFDVRERLPQIRVPTLIVHRTKDLMIDVRHSRYAAERIPGAQLVELPGEDSLPMVGDTEDLLGEVEEFLTGNRRRGGELQRSLLTVLFTDIVDATTHAARLGDGRWRDLLAAHDSTVRREIRRYDGHEVKTVGDAFLVTFDGAPSDALRCARAIVAAVRPLGLEIRAGLHTGECEIIGDDVGGMAVHIAARVNALAGAGEVLCSGTAFGTVVGSGLSFEDRGSQPLKGVPGRWPIFALNL
jgi:pimeloyl-ACP methyl ester carboxylesterase